MLVKLVPVKTLLLSILCLVAALLPPAQAQAKANALFTGACAVEVTIEFDSPVSLTGTRPDYDISLEGAVDLDASTAGQQACALTFDTFDPLRRTAAGGSGDSTLWSCTSAASSGSWTQSFLDGNGMQSPDTVFGTHSIFGTWDAWTLEVTTPSLNFVGVAELTLQSVNENEKLLNECVLIGVRSLTMVGVMVFQDP